MNPRRKPHQSFHFVVAGLLLLILIKPSRGQVVEDPGSQPVRDVNAVAALARTVGISGVRKFNGRIPPLRANGTITDDGTKVAFNWLDDGDEFRYESTTKNG